MSTTPYIAPTGHIHRRGLRLNDFSFHRLCLTFAVITTLIVTNPANDASRFLPKDGKSLFTRSSSNKKKHNQPIYRKNKKDQGVIESFAWDYLGIDINDLFDCSSTTKSSKQRVPRNMETNYITFSVWVKRFDGIQMGILNKDITVCDFDTAPEICSWLAPRLCHGYKMFDPFQKAFTALRIIQILKISSHILSKCYLYGASIFPYASGRETIKNPFSPFLSLFRQAFWYEDLPSIHLFIYPALVVLEQMCNRGTSNSETASTHFWVATFFLVIVLGGLSNLVASHISNQSLRGMKGSVAACLGYVVGATPKEIILEWMEFGMTAGDVLYGAVLLTLLSCFLGTNLIGNPWDAGDIFAWCIGGMAGNWFCKYQLEHLYAMWWRPLWKF